MRQRLVLWYNTPVSTEQNIAQMPEPVTAEVLNNIETQDSPKVGDPERYSRFVSAIIILILLLVLVGGVLAFTSPATFSAVISAFWMIIFCTVALFLVLGILIMVGLKEQVKQILDIFIEGTLSIVDIMNFLKMAVTFVVDVIKQVVYFLIPVFAYLIGAVVYFALLYAYKWVGKQFDVTLFTIFLAALLVVITGLLNRRSKDEGSLDLTWGRKLQLRFKDFIGDALEVVLFVFFLTMDSTKLFFLPSDLNVEIHSAVALNANETYNFMVRGWSFDSMLRTTLTLVMAAVGIEIARFALRIVAAGYEFYKEINAYIGETNQKMTGSDQVKWALRQSFEVHKDDVIRFITYTTFIIIVFLFFPRLKILAMAVASLTMVIMDLLMRDRLVIKKGNDLFSKLVSFLFRV